MSDADWAAAEPVLDRLFEQYKEIQENWFQMAFAKPEGTLSGARTMMAQALRYMERLDLGGDLGDGLVAGTVPLTKWVAVANAQGATLNEVVNLLGEPGLVTRFWDEVVIQTGKDVVRIVEKVVPQVVDTTKWVVVGLVALAVLIYAPAPRR